MTCAEYRNGLSLEDHARQCSACAIWIENQGSIRQGLKALADRETRGPSAAVEMALLREWKPAPRGNHRKAAVFAGALAAGLACFLFLPRAHNQQVQSVKQQPPVTVENPVEIAPAVMSTRPRRRAHRAPRPQPETASAEFFEVPFAAPLGPDERAQLLRVSMPVTTLTSWGFPMSAGDPDRVVNADVVVGENGLARAVRLIR
jgi:hypothetical protein